MFQSATLTSKNGSPSNANAGKLLIAAQFYPPHSSTTATYIATVAEELTIDNDVVVLSAVLAAKLRGAATVLLAYDPYPEAIEAAGLISRRSLTARALRLANQFLFRSLDAIITIGRDVQPLLLAYEGVSPRRIHFIPNWTLLPVGYREARADNRFRAGRHAQLVVGLSGNLGFTHSPRTVFEAARLLKNDGDIHFLLSGWGTWLERAV